MMDMPELTAETQSERYAEWQAMQSAWESATAKVKQAVDARAGSTQTQSLETIRQGVPARPRTPVTIQDVGQYVAVQDSVHEWSQRVAQGDIHFPFNARIPMQMVAQAVLYSTPLDPGTTIVRERRRPRPVPNTPNLSLIHI